MTEQKNEKKNDYIEKRKHPRINIECDVKIGCEEKHVNGKILDISLGGLKIDTINNLDIGKQYCFAYTLPNGPELKIEGEVCWRFLYNEKHIYGIKIVKIGFFQKVALWFYIRDYMKKMKSGIFSKSWLR